MNEKEELEYYMFKGTGKVVGQIAYLQPFDEHGKVPMFAQNTDNPTKGQRVTYRPIRGFTHMTDEEVHAAAEKNTSAYVSRGTDAPQVTMSGNNMPFSDMFVDDSEVIFNGGVFKSKKQGVSGVYRLHPGWNTY